MFERISSVEMRFLLVLFLSVIFTVIKNSQLFVTFWQDRLKSI